MAVGVDSERLKLITLARGDESWEEIALPVKLADGFHTVDIWYLNDAVPGGQDRNASVDWVSMVRVK